MTKHIDIQTALERLRRKYSDLPGIISFEVISGVIWISVDSWDTATKHKLPRKANGYKVGRKIVPQGRPTKIGYSEKDILDYWYNPKGACD